MGSSQMNFLLDTHVWIWWVNTPEKLAPPLRKILQRPDHELWLSPISIWEFFTLVRKGRFIIDHDPELWVEKALKNAPMQEAMLTHDIIRVDHRLKLSNADPADRFLAATAKVLDLTLVTADKHLLSGNGYRTLSAR